MNGESVFREIMITILGHNVEMKGLLILHREVL